MRVLASLSTVAITALVLASCGLDMGGLGAVATDAGGGATLDSSSATADSGSSSGSSGASSSGGDDGPSGDSTMSADASSGSSSSGADSTAPGQDSSMAESGAPIDSSAPDTYVAEAGPPPCTTANGCYVIPAGGWQLVPFATYTSTAPSCPTGFTNAPPNNLVEGPNLSSLCSCGTCSVMGPATCTGAVSDFYDIRFGGGAAGSCGTAGMPAQNSNSPAGQCGTDLYNGGTGIGDLSYKNLDLKYVTPTTVTGQCTSKGTATTSPSYAETDRSCTADNAQSGGCNGNQCTPGFASPFQVCVAKTGVQTCPGAPFTAQHLVGTSVTFTCTDCGCGVTGTCSGGTMKLFTDNACKNGELDVPADGTCHDPSAGSDSYGSYQYVANAPSNVSCQSSGSSDPQNATLANEQTICCAP